MDDSDDVIERRPVLALGLTVAVAAGAYAAVTVLMRGTVDPVETALFAVAFTAVYAVFAFYSEAIAAALGAD
jgi:hypothetical protein